MTDQSILKLLAWWNGPFYYVMPGRLHGFISYYLVELKRLKGDIFSGWICWLDVDASWRTPGLVDVLDYQHLGHQDQEDDSECDWLESISSNYFGNFFTPRTFLVRHFDENWFQSDQYFCITEKVFFYIISFLLLKVSPKLAAKLRLDVHDKIVLGTGSPFASNLPPDARARILTWRIRFCRANGVFQPCMQRVSSGDWPVQL